MISVIACSNREEYIHKIIANFKAQLLPKKELLLVLNRRMDTERIDRLLNDAEIDFQLLEFPEEITLGECLNKGVIRAKYHFVAKMDDDDYYGPYYLLESHKALVQTNAELVGKASFFIFFKEGRELRLYNPNWEGREIRGINGSQYKASYFLSGATMVFKKDILDKVTFPNVNRGEDSIFQRSCFEKKFKILSLSKNHYAYIRYNTPGHHTSNAKADLLKKKSLLISKTNSYRELVDKQ